MAKRNQQGSGATPSRAAARHAARVSSPRARVVDLGPDLPRWVAPLVFLVATVLLFPEVFFKGNTLFGHDTLGLSYFARNFYTEYVRTHHAFPLWDPMILGGLPFLEGMHGDIFYPPSIALFFLPAKAMWAVKMVIHVFLAGMFAYIWLRRGIGLRRGPSMFGGLVYMMGAEMVTLVLPGGDGKLFVSALSPLVFWLAERAASGRRLSDFAAFALGITLIVLTSHMQLAYFCIWGVTLYFFYRVYEIWRAEQNGAVAARLIGMFALAGILGVGAAAIQFLPPLHYLKTTSLRVDERRDATQTYQHAIEYSIHPEEVMSLVVPEFVGATDNGVKDGQQAPLTYWGRNLLRLNHDYVGLIALLLIPIMFLRRRARGVWFFSGLGLFALLFALGGTTPLFHLFLLVPGVKLFRAPELILFLFGLSVATLAAMAVERVIEWSQTEDEDARAITRYLWIALGVMGFIALIGVSGVLLAFWKTSIYDPATFAERPPAYNQYFDGNLTNNIGRMKAGFVIAFVLTGLLVGWWTAFRRGSMNARIAVLAICLLTVADVYRVDRPFIKTTVQLNENLAQEPFFKPDPVIAYLKQQQASDPLHVFRVATYEDRNGGAGYAYPYSKNQLAIHGIEQAGGLHGNEIGRYAQLVGGAETENVFGNFQLLNFLNIEYIVFPGEIKRMEGLDEVAKGGFNGAALYRNKAAWPRASVVGAVQVMSDSDAFSAIAASKVDLLRTAIVSENAPEFAQLQGDPKGTVKWLSRSPNSMRISVNIDKPGMLVVADNYYDAWQATVGDKPARVYRVDYTFRGVMVPAGNSVVEMHYSTDHLKAAAFTSMALMLLLLGVFASGLRRPRALLAEVDPDKAYPVA